MSGIYKRVEFSSVDSLGQFFAEAIDITPSGGGLQKIAGARHPAIEQFIRSLRPDPAYQYVLMTPMGSYEYWGANSNGDVFPEAALAYDRDSRDPAATIRELVSRWLTPHGKTLPPGNYFDFGFKTFNEALRYRHHANKNPDVAYGDIVFSVWNPRMHRVEVIARHDREKAKRVDAHEIIRCIDEGIPRQISMGAKVPFDVCTSCGHISRTTADYCDCLKFRMRSVDSMGRVTGAVNLFPRFFDLSDVFVPAAKEAGVLEKVARDSRALPTKVAASRKTAEISKEVTPNVGDDALDKAVSAEPDIPRATLSSAPFGQLLTTLAGMGIILKPHEFQEAALQRAGMSRLADHLHTNHLVFRPSPCEGHPQSRLDPDDFSPDLARALAGMLESRSAYYPHLPARVLRVRITRVAPARSYAEDSPVLQKVASVYASYRESLRSLPKFLDSVVTDNPGYYQDNFFQDVMSDALSKTAGSVHASSWDRPLVPMYVYNAHTGAMESTPEGWDLDVNRFSPARALLAPIL